MNWKLLFLSMAVAIVISVGSCWTAINFGTTERIQHLCEEQ